MKFEAATFYINPKTIKGVSQRRKVFVAGVVNQLQLPPSPEIVLQSFFTLTHKDVHGNISALF